MRDFEDSTLWRISEFERYRLRTGNSAYGPLDGNTVLPPTLIADLYSVGVDFGGGGDLLEVLAASMRHQEPVLVYLRYQGLLWPVTLFPRQGVFHSPRNILDESAGSGLASLSVMGVEPPGVRPPGDRQGDRVGDPRHFHALVPLLWTLALHGPRRELLAEIDSSARYRAVPIETVDGDLVELSGALGSALVRMRRESISASELARLPGMNRDRAHRLLNALYLASALLVTRSSSPIPKGLGWLFSGRHRKGGNH